MKNEEKAKLLTPCAYCSRICEVQGVDGVVPCNTYSSLIEMAKWKDEELKKYILELEAKNDVLKSCLRDEKSEVEILRHRIEAEKTHRMQIEDAVKSLPNSVKDLIRAFNMMF